MPTPTLIKPIATDRAGLPFRTVLLDPPWPENGGGKCKRGADRHYKTMRLRDVFPTVRLAPLWRIADSAHMYLWVTNNYLPAGLKLMGELDFRYVTNLAWIKDRDGLGQYFRGRHELLLFGVRGRGFDVRTERRDLSTVIAGEDSCIGHPRGEHSAKPEVFHDLIEQRSQGPYLEMFARTRRVGWQCWGDELAELTP